MAEQTVRGSCLCKSVRYEVSTPFARFGHCYCSRCRKATGGVRSTNIAVPIAQFRWTQGEELVKRFVFFQRRTSFADRSAVTVIVQFRTPRATANEPLFPPVPSTMYRRGSQRPTATVAAG